MTEPETIDAEVTEELGQALEVHQPAPVNLFRTEEPTEIIRRATETADALAGVIEDKKLYALIRGKKHVTLEGWTLLGSMLGVFPVAVWSKPLEGGWEARVEARTRDGSVVGAAEASCMRAEGRPWDKADEYAVRSMAQTRAASKALRMPLGFVMTLGGYEATPEGEMPREGGQTAEVRVEHDPLPLPTSWPKVTEYVSAYDEATYALFQRFTDAARRYIAPGSVDAKLLEGDDKETYWRVVAGAAHALRTSVDPAKFPPPTEEDLVKAFASVLDGAELSPAAPEPDAPDPEKMG